MRNNSPKEASRFEWTLEHVTALREAARYRGGYQQFAHAHGLSYASVALAAHRHGIAKPQCNRVRIAPAKHYSHAYAEVLREYSDLTPAQIADFTSVSA